MKGSVALLVILLLAQTVHAAEPSLSTCPDQVDFLKRKLLKLSDDFDASMRDTSQRINVLGEQKQILLDNAKLSEEVGQSGWKASSYYKEAWQDAEKRAARQWYESPGFLIPLGVFIGLAAVAGAIGVGKALEARLPQPQ